MVIVPKSTVSNWKNEFDRWCPTIRTVVFIGNKDDRVRVVLAESKNASEKFVLLACNLDCNVHLV